MIEDELNKEDENKVIEILVENVWIPVIATSLWIAGNDTEIRKVKAVRVRDLKK